MPKLDQPVGLPIKEVLLPTESKPFNLEIERRVEARVSKWEKDVQEELRKQREQAQSFRAQPPKVQDTFENLRTKCHLNLFPGVGFGPLHPRQFRPSLL